MRYLHTGITVKNIDKTLQLYGHLGYSVEKLFERPDLDAHAAQIKHIDGTVLELWQFESENHRQIRYIKQHVAFGSNALEEDVAVLTQTGYRLVIPITQGAILRYAFVQDPSGNCLEIAQI